MNISKNGLDLIKQFEGLKLNAYQCSAGVWTIGYGSTFFPNGQKVKKGDKLHNEAEALEMVETTLQSFEAVVEKAVKIQLTQNEFDALVCFTYNVGAGNLNSSTLLKLLNKNTNRLTVSKEFLKWDKAGGKALAGLTRRRQAESELFLKG